MSYVADYFRDRRFSIQPIEELIPVPFIDVYRITDNFTSFTTFFRWNGALDNNVEQWSSLIRRIKAILMNRNGFEREVVYDYESLQQFVSAYFPNLTPEDKLNSILDYLHKLSSFGGESIALDFPNDDVANELYFANLSEWLFYFNTAIELRYIAATEPEGKNEATLFNLTISGLSRLLKAIELRESKYCFIAMAFNEEMDVIYQEAIESAVVATGFIPYIVNRVNVDSDKTINDAIVAGLKKARFTIADFTYHKDGVYFEAGYALGRGQKVIYTCREDEMGQAHFDIRNYQHIVWSVAEDLKAKLIDKIEAFILD